jgi:hypothetical protein
VRPKVLEDVPTRSRTMTSTRSSPTHLSNTKSFQNRLALLLVFTNGTQGHTGNTDTRETRTHGKNRHTGHIHRQHAAGGAQRVVQRAQRKESGARTAPQYKSTHRTTVPTNAIVPKVPRFALFVAEVELTPGSLPLPCPLPPSPSPLRDLPLLLPLPQARQGQWTGGRG